MSAYAILKFPKKLEIVLVYDIFRYNGKCFENVSANNLSRLVLQNENIFF